MFGESTVEVSDVTRERNLWSDHLCSTSTLLFVVPATD